MSLDSVTPLTAVQALLAGLNDGNGHPLLKNVDIGVPVTIGNAVGAYVALAGQTTRIVATEVFEREATIYVGIAYQVVGAPAGAELALAAALDALLRALYADLSLGGVTREIKINLGLSGVPVYQSIAGIEFRTFPLTLGIVQRDNFNANP